MGFFTDLKNEIFADHGFSTSETSHLDFAALSDLLTYRVYDKQDHIYYNEKSTGFILQTIPYVITEEVCANLHAAITTEMPSNGGIQFLNWSSPNIAPALRRWGAHRTQGGELLREMTMSRANMFQSKSYGTDALTKAIPLQRQVFVCGWIEGDNNLSNIAELKAFRKSVATALGIRTDEDDDNPKGFLKPAGLLRLLREILHAEDFGDADKDFYTSEQTINEQLPGASIKVARNFVQLAGDPLVNATVSSVAKFPGEWEESLGVLLHGHPDIIGDRPHGPVLTSFSAVSTAKQKILADMMKKTVIMDRAEKTGLSKFETDFAGKQKEIVDLTKELDGSERLFHTSFTVVAYSKGTKEEAKAAQNEMSKIYRRAGFNLRKETYFQLPLLLGALPLGMTTKYLAAYGRGMRMRVLKGAAVAKLAPIHGEYAGNSNGQGMLLTGRQGEVMCFSNYISTGNYNMCFVGKSGAGKSVAMQECITAIYANGGRALIIDDGESFKTTCEILGGTHIAFDGSVPLKLNPFSMLDVEGMGKDSYRAEAIELVSNIITSMVDLGVQKEGRVAVEEAEINHAVGKVWDEKQQAGEVTDVYDILLEKSENEPRLIDVCTTLYRFCRGGDYGEYFTGPASVKIENAFTVVEMSHIKSQKALEQVVLQLVMFLGSELMYKTPREVPVAILIDEAWDMLQGQGTAKFIEGVARRARKYTGCIITGTQSIDDYFANPAANVCYQNSDWVVMLAQKGETLDRLVAENKLSVPDGFVSRLKTITSVAGSFSEMAVKGPEGSWFFGRLLLDPFSLAVYSSKGSTVEGINARKRQGYSTVEAIKEMIAMGEVS